MRRRSSRPCCRRSYGVRKSASIRSRTVGGETRARPVEHAQFAASSGAERSRVPTAELSRRPSSTPARALPAKRRASDVRDRSRHAAYRGRRLGRSRCLRSSSILNTRVARVKRVAVTGIGAVTPLGLDAQATWRAALAGESGIDWISTSTPTASRSAIAGEVKGFDPTHGRLAEGGRKLDRNVLLALGAAREAMARRRPERLRPEAGRDHLRLRDRRHPGIARAARRAPRARARPRLAELPAERARRLGLRASSRSRSGSRARTTRSSPPARPARTRSARRPS